MSRDYDIAIIGGGIAGLMSAARLALAGRSVAVFEKDKLGSAASTGNHGMIHSGALYAELHPEIVRQCTQALSLFQETFPDAVVGKSGAYFFSKEERLASFGALWEKQRCAARILASDKVDDVLRVDNLDGYSFAESNDLTVSSRDVMLDMAAICSVAGVQLHVGAPVSEIIVEAGKVTGLEVGGEGRIRCRDIVLCAGLGTAYFAQKLSLKMADRLKSRLDMMVAFEGNGLAHTVLCLEYGGPAIAPTLNGTILASLYGGIQPAVESPRRWSVPFSNVSDLIEQCRSSFRDGLIDYGSGRAYMCSKTEYSMGRADPWGVEPGSVVLDHGAEDSIQGLWTLLPGKMTLGFHASQSLAETVLGRSVDLVLPRAEAAARESTCHLVDYPPWHPLDE